jgi:hypothetical protein
MPHYNYNDSDSDSDTDASADTHIDIDHDAEIETFFRVKKKLDGLPTLRGIPVRAEGRICKALDKLGTFPIFTFESPKDPDVTIDGEYVGRDRWPPYEIKLDPILAKGSMENYASSTGEQSTRRVVRGESIKLEYDWKVSGFMHRAISAMAFRYRSFSHIDCKLRNLCLYSSGGGLEWRREAPLDDRHRGTVLVALDTNWTGVPLATRERCRGPSRHATPNDFFRQRHGVGDRTGNGW